MGLCTCKLLAHPGRECPWWAEAGYVLGQAGVGIDLADPWDGDSVEMALDLLPLDDAHQAADLLGKSGFVATPSGGRHLKVHRKAVA